MRALAPTFEEGRWVPPPSLVGGYRISEFMKKVGFEDLQDLARWGANDPEQFYPAVHDFLDVRWLRDWTLLRDDSLGTARTRWFVGGGTNVAWLACERWSNATNPALIWEGDDGSERTLTFPQLADAVRRAATGFKSLGVGAGDVVAMHFPPLPEAVVTMLAVARIGAVVAPAFSGYGVAPLAERLNLSRAKILVTADGFMRRGAEVQMLPTALAAAGQAPTVQRVVVVGRLRPLDLAEPSIVSWELLCCEDDEAPMPIHDTDTPWLLMYTSGSTGRPKGAVHTHGGFPYVLATEMGLSVDVRQGDRFAYPADLGWIAGPMCTIGPLSLGASTVMFEGVVDYPRPDRAWRLIERHNVTQFGTSPSAIRMLAEAGTKWTEPFDLPSLRVLVTAGEPMTSGAWRWLHKNVGRGWVPLVNWSGGTEIGGSIVSGYPNWPTAECHFSGPVIGMDVDVVDEGGAPVIGEVGELVLRRTSPGTTKGFWNEPQRYLDTYWSQLPDLWVHGDRAIRYADGSFEIPGRSDDLMKIAGKRVGPVELESIALEVEGVAAAAAVGVDDPIKGQVAVLVITATRNGATDADLPKRVSDRIATVFGKPMRPAAVLVVPDLPRTRSGKTHRRVVRGWITGTDPGDLSSLDNPEAEPALREAAMVLTARRDTVS